MKRLRSLAALAVVALLAGCGGGSSLKPSAQTPAAAQTAMVTLTVLTRAPSSVARSPRYIAPNAQSVAISVAPGNPQYVASGACATIVSGITVYTLQVPAPIGNDVFTVQTFDGPCSGNGGTGHVIGATKAIAGTVTAGAANVLNPNGVAPAQPCAGSCTMTIGALYNAAAATFSLSLSTSTPNLTTFAFDPGVTMAVPLNFALTDPAGNPLVSPDANGNPVTLLQPVTIAVTDTSIGAVPGTLGIALVNGQGYVYCPQNAGTVLFAAAATPSCLQSFTTAGTLLVNNVPVISTLFATAPRATDRLVLVYNGASQSAFQSATVTATAGSTTLGSIVVTGQPQAGTFKSGGAPVVFPANATAVAYAPAGGVAFVTAGSQVYPFTPLSTLGGPSTALAGASFTAIAGLSATTSSIYAVDRNCHGCDATHVGIEQWPATAAGVSGTVPVQLTALPGVVTSGLDASGPIGIAGLSPALGGANPYGSLLVAANNAIYRLDLASATTISAIAQIAGSGTPGAPGSGFVDSPTGTSALFNFGGVAFVGLALNPQGTALLVADAQNAALRQVSLSGSNAVSTLAVYPSAPSGVAVDPVNGLILTTHPALGTIESVAPGGGTPAIFAGKTGGASSQDGLGLQAYPLQFNAGNAVASSLGGSAGAAYAVLYDPSGSVLLGPNSTQAAQSAAGVSSFVASFWSPTGIAVDPLSPPNARFAVLDAGSRMLRTVL